MGKNGASVIDDNVFTLEEVKSECAWEKKKELEQKQQKIGEIEDEIPASSEVRHIRSNDIYMCIHVWANESSKNVHGKVKNKTMLNSIYNFSKRYSQLLEAKHSIFIVHTY